MSKASIVVLSLCCKGTPENETHVLLSGLPQHIERFTLRILNEETSNRKKGKHPDIASEECSNHQPRKQFYILNLNVTP